MMRFKKLATMAVFMGAICLMTTGCGKMTAEKLKEKVNAATEGKDVTYSEMIMDLEASYDLDVMGMNMSMDFVMDAELNQWVNVSPFSGYSEGRIQMNLMEQDIDTEIKGHTVIEDDKIVTYTYVGMMDSWAKEDTGMSASDYEEYLLTAPTFGSESSDMILEEEISQLDGKEVYVIQVNYTGSDVEELLSDAGPMSGYMDVEEGSMKDMTIPATFYVDTKTFLPVQLEMEIEGMENFVNQMLMGEMEALGETDEDTEVAVEVEKCHVIMKNFSYEAQEIPAVPQEAIDSIALAEALENAGPTLADGRFLLKYESNAVAVSAPEGYQGGVTDAVVELYSDDGLRMAVIAAAPAGMTAMIEEQTVTAYEQMFSALGITLETSESTETVATKYGDVDVAWLGTQGLNMYYGVVPVKGLDLFIMGIDMAGSWQEAADIIVPVTEAVSQVTLEDLK